MKIPKALWVFPGATKDATPGQLNYQAIVQEKMDRVMAEHGLDSYRCEVNHDEWCSINKGKPECNCNPDVIIYNSKGKVVA